MDNNHKNKTMLYLMHVSWYWIKQRPHFLAENLKEYYDVTVLYPKSFFNNRQMVKENRESYVHSFITLPLQRFRNYSVYINIENFFIVFQIKRHIRNKDIIWISDPFIYKIVKNYVKKSQIIIYDCMDDALEFPVFKINPELKESFTEAEENLLLRANTVFASSQYLKTKLQLRYKLNKNIDVINNAISNSFFNIEYCQEEIVYPQKNEFIDLLYIGTISQWFNFELMLKSLNQFKNIRLILIGPTDVTIPESESIIYIGSKKHSELHKYMENADALIMPFIVNDLIKSVNPVKLYEYIYSGKPVITCSYSEIDQFDQFVFRYETDEQFFNLIQKLINKELMVRSEVDRLNFLQINTWQKRTDEILKILDVI
jgi:teichuronic acid biosynthesis glycosyltransferase TuaH